MWNEGGIGVVTPRFQVEPLKLKNVTFWGNVEKSDKEEILIIHGAENHKILTTAIILTDT